MTHPEKLPLQGEGSADNDQANVDRVLSALDTEIAKLSDEQRLPGWSQWALLAALGTMVWLALDIAVDHGIKGLHADHVLLFLSMIVALDALLPLRVLLTERRYLERRTFRLSSSVFHHRPSILVSLARSAGVALAVSLVIEAWLPRFALASIYVLTVILLMLALAISYLHIPLPEGQWSSDGQAKRNMRTATVMIGVILAVLAAGAASLWREVLTRLSAGVIRLPDVQLAMLLVAMVWLLGKMVAVSQPLEALRSLWSIRRELAFGRVGPAEAVRQADIILSGAKLSDAMAEPVGRFVSALDHIRANAAKQVDVLSAALAQVADLTTISGQQRILLESAMTTCREYEKQYAGVWSDVKASKTMIFRRLRLVGGLASMEDVDDVSRLMTAAMDACDQRLSELKELKEKVNGALRSDRTQ